MSSTQADASRLAVDWANGYCGSVGQLITTFATLPTVDPSTPQRASRSASQLLNSVINGLEVSLRELNRLGPAPVAAAETLKANSVGTFTSIRDRVAGAKGQLDSAPEGSPASQQALGAANTPLHEISDLNVLDGLNDVPELASASARAPSCQQLSSPTPEPAPGPAPEVAPGR